MGRGTSTRSVLPLAEAPFSSHPNLLRLPFVEGGLLEVSWDIARADVQVFDHALDPRGSVIMTRNGLAIWLSEVARLAESFEGEVSLMSIDLAWKRGASGPSLHLYHSSSVAKLFVGTLASVDLLRDLLSAARAEGLF